MTTEKVDRHRLFNNRCVHTSEEVLVNLFPVRLGNKHVDRSFIVQVVDWRVRETNLVHKLVCEWKPPYPLNGKGKPFVHCVAELGKSPDIAMLISNIYFACQDAD